MASLRAICVSDLPLGGSVPVDKINDVLKKSGLFATTVIVVRRRLVGKTTTVNDSRHGNILRGKDKGDVVPADGVSRVINLRVASDHYFAELTCEGEGIPEEARVYRTSLLAAFGKLDVSKVPSRLLKRNPQTAAEIDIYQPLPSHAAYSNNSPEKPLGTVRLEATISEHFSRPMTDGEKATAFVARKPPVIGELDPALPLAACQKLFVEDAPDDANEDKRPLRHTVAYFMGDYETVVVDGRNRPYMHAFVGIGTAEDTRVQTFCTPEGDTCFSEHIVEHFGNHKCRKLVDGGMQGGLCYPEDCVGWAPDALKRRSDLLSQSEVLLEKLASTYKRESRHAIHSESGRLAAKAKRILPHSHVVVFYHNLGFDREHAIAAFKRAGFIPTKPLNNGGRPVCLTLKHAELLIDVELRCSFRVLTEAVARLPATFSFADASIRKEVMLHDIITPELFKSTDAFSTVRLASVLGRIRAFNARPENAAHPFSEEAFVNALKTLVCISDDGRTVNLQRYVEYYCMQDVRVCATALQQFDGILDTIDRDLRTMTATTRVSAILLQTVAATDNFSAAGVADRLYTRAAGAYDGVCLMDARLGRFVRACLAGGRCTLGAITDEKPTHLCGRFDYLDAVSLYPSAMVSGGGFLLGEAQHLDIRKYPTAAELLRDAHPYATVPAPLNGYFVACRVKDTATEPRPLPLGVYPLRPAKAQSSAPVAEDEEEATTTLRWVSDLRGVGEVYFDAISLPDYCSLTGVAPSDIEVLRGVYYDGGRNPNIKAAVEELFNLRLQAKRTKNGGLSAVIKICLNSAYGRTIMREQTVEEHYANSPTELIRMVKKKYPCLNSITEATFEDDVSTRTWTVETQAPLKNSHGRWHCGIEVLSQSRVIMNRVVRAAADVGAPIYYTDTDSLCVNADDKARIIAAYEAANPDGQTLEGDALGQFHSDFDLSKDAFFDVEATKPVDTGGEWRQFGDVWSNEVILLGKKVYCHRLESRVRKVVVVKAGWTGPVPAVPIYGFKYSLKGVSDAAIRLKALELCGNAHNVWSVYAALYCESQKPYQKRVKLSFDMSAGGKPRFGLENRHGLHMASLPALERALCFGANSALVGLKSKSAVGGGGRVSVVGKRPKPNSRLITTRLPNYRLASDGTTVVQFDRASRDYTRVREDLYAVPLTNQPDGVFAVAPVSARIVLSRARWSLCKDRYAHAQSTTLGGFLGAVPRQVAMHRVVIAMELGGWDNLPPGRGADALTVDHINGLRFDNAPDNLRLATKREQRLNQTRQIELEEKRHRERPIANYEF